MFALNTGGFVRRAVPGGGGLYEIVFKTFTFSVSICGSYRTTVVRNGRKR